MHLFSLQVHSFSWYTVSDGSRAENEVIVEDWLPKPSVGKHSFPELIFLGMIEEKKIDAAQLGKVNSIGSRLLGSAASVTSNKPVLPDRTPDRNAGCRGACRLQADMGEMENWRTYRWRCRGCLKQFLSHH